MFVTALRDASDRLRLLVWRLDSAGKIEVRGKFVTEGIINEVDVAPLFHNDRDRQFLTALKDQSNRLRLISWRVSSDGRNIVRLDTFTGPPIDDVKVHQGLSGVIVAARSPEGKLIVGDFFVDSKDGKITSKGTLNYGSATSLSLSTLDTLALRDGSGRLRITEFVRTTPFSRNETIIGEDITEVHAENGNNGRVYAFAITGETTAVKQGLLCNQRLILGHGHAVLSAWDAPDGRDGPNGEPGRRKLFRVPLNGHDGIAKFANLIVHNGNVDEAIITVHAGYDSFCQKTNPGRQRLPDFAMEAYTRQLFQR